MFQVDLNSYPSISTGISKQHQEILQILPLKQNLLSDVETLKQLISDRSNSCHAKILPRFFFSWNALSLKTKLCQEKYRGNKGYTSSTSD